MKLLLLKMIRFYQRHLSHRKGPSCRFQPTCSQYALTSIERFGPLRGGSMAVWRILRCNPFCKGGYDPVPENPDSSIRRD